MTRLVMILNGPNLGRLGARQPEIYGELNLSALEAACRRWAEELGLEVDPRQTDDEAELIGWLHQAADQGTAVVLNPAAFTHYSYAVHDAAAEVDPLIEVHISNPAGRDSFRRHSVISAVARGTIAGFGFDSYRLALDAISRLMP